MTDVLEAFRKTIELNKEMIEKKKAEWKEKSSKYTKTYNDKNRDKLKARSQKWYQANIDRIRAYRQSNKEIINARTRAWQKANPQKVAELFHIRYRSLAQSIPSWYEAEAVALIYKKRDELNELYGLELEVDHIIPINPRGKTVCGLHCWANLQLLDKGINGSKSDSYQTDW